MLKGLRFIAAALQGLPTPLSNQAWQREETVAKAIAKAWEVKRWVVRFKTLAAL